jgi:hypothetical protein
MAHRLGYSAQPLEKQNGGSWKRHNRGADSAWVEFAVDLSAHCRFALMAYRIHAPASIGNQEPGTEEQGQFA